MTNEKIIKGGEKKKKLAMILILLVLSVPFVYVSDSESASIEMKSGHFAADSHPGNLASKMFAEGVEKRTNGNIKVIIYPNNALFFMERRPCGFHTNISGLGIGWRKE